MKSLQSMMYGGGRSGASTSKKMGSYNQGAMKRLGHSNGVVKRLGHTNGSSGGRNSMSEIYPKY